MSELNIVIREIEQRDNVQIEKVIKDCFPEWGIPMVGTAYEDPETSNMFEAYQNNREVYYVVDNGDEVLGGAGIKKLLDFEGNVCELQKMYFAPKARGLGLGQKMLDKCLEAAKGFGFKTCYLESASQLKSAIKLYEKIGFQYLDEPMGNTGHYSCGIWMTKAL
ncbi:MAG: GNAT family N-acetyltransferase [Bacteroidota bacterium]